MWAGTEAGSRLDSFSNLGDKTMRCHFLDAHFWVSVVGTECDKGLGTPGHLVAELVRLTSLDAAGAGEVLAEMERHGKLALIPGTERFDCTIKS